MTEGDSCTHCGEPLVSKGNFFVSELQSDLLWYCQCGQAYDVEHDCYEDFCSEVLTVALPKTTKSSFAREYSPF